MKRPSISMIGPGKVGTALARLAAAEGYTINAIGGRDAAQAKAAAILVGEQTRALSIEEAAAASEVVILAVSDSAIEEVALDLARGGSMQDGSMLVHCSGALTSELLFPVKVNASVSVASFHPLQTFPTLESAMTSLPGSHCFLEGDDRALEMLEVFGAALGTQCVRIETDAKVLYHAGAVLACNYLCSLIDAALGANEAAGIGRGTAMMALRPLIETTLSNIVNLGPAAALTGPIQRGDAQTVDLHMRTLEDAAPNLARLYQALGESTLSLAEGKASFNEATRTGLRRALALDS
jgi:predicted short-subunit dehydrogenase-like oxidoreductase (DUF2520 family)